MIFKDKFKLIFLSIITLGIYPLVVFKKSKPKQVSKELSSSEKINLDFNKLVEALGGKTNITGATATHKKVKIEIKSKDSVDLPSLEKLKGISGVFASSTSISIIVGNSAKKIASMM